MKIRKMAWYRWLLLLIGLWPGLTLEAQALPNSINSKWESLLEEIVNINSGTGNAVGLDRVRSILIHEFEALGYTTSLINAGDQNKVLSFDFPTAQPEILFVGHLDTVFEKENPFQSFTKIGTTISGPGVIDMKGGIILMLNLLAAESLDHRSKVRIVLNDDEETGSTHSRAILRQQAVKIKYGLVFEPGLGDGSVVTEHSGVRWLKLNVYGRAAHAGLEPEKGINACLEASYKIAKISALSEPERGLTVNVGTIEGGAKPNIVCDQASLTIDIRYRKLADLTEVLAQIETIRSHSSVFNYLLNEGTKSTIESLAELPGMPIESTYELFELAKQSASAVGIEITGRGVGYASDGNNLSETGIQLLVGVGPYGGGMHTNKEFMLTQSYAERLAWLLELTNNILTKGAKQNEK